MKKKERRTIGIIIPDVRNGDASELEYGAVMNRPGKGVDRYWAIRARIS